MATIMPKVLEEANLSGELRLSGRKLKDFPKTAAKYNLSDTVIAGKPNYIYSRYNIWVGFFIHCTTYGICSTDHGCGFST